MCFGGGEDNKYWQSEGFHRVGVWGAGLGGARGDFIEAISGARRSGMRGVQAVVSGCACRS